MVKSFLYSLLIIITLSILSGCISQEPRIVYKPVNIPVQFTPAPPIVNRPTLYITTLTDTQKNDIGEMSKAYVITGKQLMQYACLLEKVYNKYTELSKNNPTLYPASSSTVPTEVQALASKPNTSSSIDNIVKQIQLTPKDYNDCDKAGP